MFIVENENVFRCSIQKFHHVRRNNSFGKMHLNMDMKS